MKKMISLLVLLCALLPAIANVRLPKLFTDHMVLQRDHAIAIWGWADGKEKITVSLNKQSKTITADKTGKWKISLDAEVAGGPYILTVKGKNSIQIHDVYIGEVWICSGQSNMEMPLGSWGFIQDYQKEIDAAEYPMIREFAVPKQVALQPRSDIGGDGWKVCSPETVAPFSAVAYFFARELYKELQVPIGLINTTWGGTMVETWTSREAYENSEEFKAMISEMPTMSLEEMQKVKVEQAKNKLNQLQGGAPSANEAASWSQFSLGDKDWHSIVAPGVWESQEPGDLDGIVWIRKTIEVDAANAGKAATLELAMIDDKDETYLNGTLIGSTSLYNAPRKYQVPAGVLKPGKNVIAVRVTDTGGGGGIFGDAADLKLTINQSVISLAGKWLYRIEEISTGQSQIGPNNYPTLLFNAMISPLIPYTIRGAIWYQGESNAGRAFEYRKSFPLMINDWRQRWQQGNFPFYFVQLSSFASNNGNSEKGSDWAELREAQAQTLSLPNTGMAVTTDIGDAKDIHPKNKQDVGRRLAAIALHNTYEKEMVYSGPVFESFTIDRDKLIVSFKSLGGGLIAKDKYGYVKGFEIAGADQRFHYATASIEGNKIVLKNLKVPQPVAARYGWADDAGENNLFNKEGFPAAPFRTDKWKGVTDNNKYRITQ